MVDKRDIIYKKNTAIRLEDTWIPADQTLTVAGQEISGMVYIGTREDGKFGKYFDSVIDPNLPVKEFNRQMNSQIGLSTKPWSYGAMAPMQRAIYLKWLTSGRSADGFHENYILLFLLGLERRFFIDSPTEQESQLILSEVKRLLQQYSGKYPDANIDRILRKLIHAINAIILPVEDIEPHYLDTEIDGKIPLDIGVAMKNKINTSQQLNHEWFVVLYLICSGNKLRSPVQRALPEFLVVLSQLFEKNFPNGLPIPQVTGKIHPTYMASAQGFSVDLLRHLGAIPDLATISSLNEEAIELINQAGEIVYEYGRYLATEQRSYSPLNAYKRLPESIKPYCLPPGLKELKTMVEKAVSSNEIFQ